MRFMGVTIICDADDQGRCLVIHEQIGNRYFENQAAAEAFVARFQDLDDDGYPD